MKIFVFFYPSIVESPCAAVIKLYNKDAVLVPYDFRKTKNVELFKKFGDKDTVYFLGSYIKEFPKRSGNTIVICTNEKKFANVTKVVSVDTTKNSMIEETLKLFTGGKLEDISFGARVIKGISFHNIDETSMLFKSYLYVTHKLPYQDHEFWLKLLKGYYDEDLTKNGEKIGKYYREVDIFDAERHIKEKSYIHNDFLGCEKVMIYPSNYKITTTAEEALKQDKDLTMVVTVRMLPNYKDNKMQFSYTLTSKKLSALEVARKCMRKLNCSRRRQGLSEYTCGGSVTSAGFTIDEDPIKFKEMLRPIDPL
jgi:hypothetical protein